MTDSTSAPPVAASAGTPTLPPEAEIAAFFEALEAKGKIDMWKSMAAQVPPLLQAKFLEKFPAPPAVTTPPVDANDVRQADAKRGEAGPGEPTSYVDAQGNTIDPKVLPETVT